MIDESTISGQLLSVPVRVVMSNKIFTAFSGMNQDDQKSTFKLMSTRIYKSLKHKNCFVLSEDKNTRTFCDFGVDTTDRFYAEWNYDFNLFKFQCSEDDKIVKINDFVSEIDKKVQLEKQRIQIDYIQAKAEKLIQTEPEKEVEIRQKEEPTLKVIEKEMKIEKILEQEEIEREKLEENEINLKIESEQKKKDCILKAIKEKELEAQFNVKEKSKAESFEIVNEIAKKQIFLQRERLKKKIEVLKKRAEAKKQLKTQQLMTIRMEIADQLSNAYKKGRIDNCKKAIISEIEWSFYCKGAFITSLHEQYYCLKMKQDCSFCCDTEFGSVFVDDRIDCQEKICSKVGQEEETPEESNMINIPQPIQPNPTATTNTQIIEENTNKNTQINNNDYTKENHSGFKKEELSSHQENVVNSNLTVGINSNLSTVTNLSGNGETSFNAGNNLAFSGVNVNGGSHTVSTTTRTITSQNSNSINLQLKQMELSKNTDFSGLSGVSSFNTLAGGRSQFLDHHIITGGYRTNSNNLYSKRELFSTDNIYKRSLLGHKEFGIENTKLYSIKGGYSDDFGLGTNIPSKTVEFTYTPTK